MKIVMRKLARTAVIIIISYRCLFFRRSEVSMLASKTNYNGLSTPYKVAGLNVTVPIINGPFF
ncbi:MAG: hypothetical protein Alis3KO_02840 [Aliiglaciecola sp.]